MKYSIAFLCTFLIVACNAPEKKRATSNSATVLSVSEGSPIGEYVVEVFEDSKKNLWFGTLEKGVAQYDGTSLHYLTTKDGLPSNRVVSIVEDDQGTLWFGTGSGIASYDGATFTTYSEADGLCSDMISTLLIDQNGLLWIGTWGGVCTFNGTTFETFTLPKPKITTPINKDTENWITGIIEDKHGNIWFGRDGYGATKFDGNDFTFHLKKDGLYSNHLTEIQEGREGVIWFASRIAEKDNADPEKRSGLGGITTFNGTSYTHFPDIAGLHNGDSYEIFMDRSENMWIGTVEHGIYRFDGTTFENFKVPISIMSMVQDTEGTLWLGGAGGLYKITKNGSVSEVTTEGPW